jgi:hypothetical protein
MIDQLREESEHMRHELSHPGHQAEKLRKWFHDPDVRLTGSLIGGTLVWGLYFSALNALNSLACRWGWFGLPAESGDLKLIQIVVTVLAAVLIAAFGYNAYDLWRATRRKASSDSGAPGNPIEPANLVEPGNLEQTVAAYTPFVAFVLLLLNALYLLIVLISLAPIATLANCGG